ncbi:MAG: LysM peptidoglycan-binding domain-containing protein [Candidatus Flexifilum sp.]
MRWFDRMMLTLALIGLILVPVQGQEAGDLVVHVVQRGDTLFQIAQRYGVTIDAIARANGIASPGNIRTGQRLIIPRSADIDSQSVQIHTVQPGETLGAIARLYGVSLDDLIAWNGLTNPNTLFVGQTIRLGPDGVPAAESDGETAPEDGVPDVSASLLDPNEAAGQPLNALPVSTESLSLIHVVLPGETLFRIGQSYGVPVNAIIQANDIDDPSLIYPGQQLMIPGVQAPQLASPLPPPFLSAQVLPLVFVEGRTGMFRVITAEPAAVSGSFLGRTLVFVSENDGTRHTALIGIPLGTAAGIYPAQITAAGGAGGSGSLEANVQVAAGGYGVEQFTLLGDRSYLLDPAIDEAELSLLRTVTSAVAPQRRFSGSFGLPAAATITSPFGSTRSYDNGAILRAHLGTDFAGVPGTPILAAAPGTVVLADTLNVRGVATVIDHGWGVYTGYYHQTERYVGIGAAVSEGQVIGTIGSSGRVSGPHLHWEVWVAGTPVDPMQWVLTDFTR